MASMTGNLSWLPLTLGNSNANLEVLHLAGIEYRDLRFPNGDSYKGGWREGQVRRTALRAAASRRWPPR